MNRRVVAKALGLFMLTVVALIHSQRLQAADKILTNGRIYTAQKENKWAEAIAITGSRIDRIGTSRQILQLRGPKTEVIDLQGRTVIPGIIDSHTHLWYGALGLYGLNLSSPEYNITDVDEEELIRRLKAFAETHPKDEWIVVRGQFRLGVNAPSAMHGLLDRAVADRPVVVIATSVHDMWVNGKALQLAGVTDKPYPDPEMEQHITRDENGRPTGVIREGAMELIRRVFPGPRPGMKAALLLEALKEMNRNGVTSVVNVTGDLTDLKVYADLHRKGQLTARVRSAFGEVAINHKLTPQFLKDLEAGRSLQIGDWVTANLVKLFSDGIRGNHTMASLEPYDGDFRGTTFYTRKDYQKVVLDLDKRGYQVITHAIGDAAARMVLDTYEKVNEINGARDRRFRIEHAGSLNAQDLPRFGKLDVIPSMQPGFCCAAPRAGGNVANAWQSLEKSGATLAFSSDWPCTWPPDPFRAIQQAVTRQIRRPATKTGPATGPIEYSVPEERLSVEQALLAYTRNAAYANFTEKKNGVLEAGKLADLVVLSQDIFSVPSADIGKTRAVITMVGGRIVYEDEKMNLTKLTAH